LSVAADAMAVNLSQFPMVLEYFAGDGCIELGNCWSAFGYEVSEHCKLSKELKTVGFRE
jgi:hypothetical protein